MKKRAILSIIFGTIILFVWNAVSWMALPFHSSVMHTIPDNAMDFEHVKRSMPETGIYHFPGFPETNTPEAMAALETTLENGPRITMMAYINEPTTFFAPSTFLISLLSNFLTVLLILFIVSKLRVKNLKEMLTVTIVLAVIAALVGDIATMNWYLFPFDYTMINILDKIIGFMLLGLLFGLYTIRGQVQT